MVLWEGAVQRQRVCDVFRVNPNHVTRDIQVYKKQYPKSLEYNPSVRAYEPGIMFEPRLASGDPTEYLALLHAYAESHSVAMLPVLGGDGQLVEALPAPKHSVDQNVLRAVVQATRHGKGLKVVYNSMQSDQPKPRTLWPHTLVHTGLHWHIRAYDDLRSTFRNFAIQRIAKIDVVVESGRVSVHEDAEWNEKVLIEVIPNPKLNTHQQGIVAKEYGMTENEHGWVWSEQIRRCLVGYFAVHYRLDLQPKGDPQFTPLVFKDYAAVRPHLFEGSTGGG
jgi:predicted DNA-binding transcriptional regulator YafY